MIKSSDKLVLNKAVKMQDRAMKKWNKGKFWTENRDCPSKSGIVGGYALCLEVTIIIFSYILHYSFYNLWNNHQICWKNRAMCGDNIND